MENYVGPSNVDNYIKDHNSHSENIEEEYTPKLFSEDNNDENIEENSLSDDNRREDKLFNQDTHEEEDFEIPAFLRRQKF